MRLTLRPFTVLLLGIAGAGLLALALVLASSGEANNPKQAPPRSTFSLEQAMAFSDYDLYNAGETFEGTPLVAVLRRNDRAKYVSFIYGTCVAISETGCAPRFEIQVWPACVRSLALYDASIPGSPRPELTTVRGVPGAYFDGGQRLEVHTGRAQVVIFAESAQAALRVAEALRGVNASTPFSADLPEPAPGAVEGRLPC